MKTQVAHDTKISGIGGHQQRGDRWHLMPPLCKGFESKESERVWQDLDDVFAGIPAMVKRYLRKLLRCKALKENLAGADMCTQLGLDPKDVVGGDVELAPRQAAGPPCSARTRRHPDPTARSAARWRERATLARGGQHVHQRLPDLGQPRDVAGQPADQIMPRNVEREPASCGVCSTVTPAT
jgi:hypothetical protein